MEAVDLSAVAANLWRLLELAQDDPFILVMLLILAPLFSIVGWRILRAAVTMLSWLILAGVVAAAAIILGAGAL